MSLQGISIAKGSRPFDCPRQIITAARIRSGERHRIEGRTSAGNPRLKAYLLKESLSQLWNYTYEGATLRYLQRLFDQLPWQRLKPMEKLARRLEDHVEGILNYCRTKVPAQRLAATKTEFLGLQKAA